MSQLHSSIDKPGMVFCALADDRKVLVSLGKSGAVDFRRHNMLKLPQEATEFLETSAAEYWFPQPQDTPLPKPGWIVNTCTDPDSFAQALDWLSETFGKDVPIFNHPAALENSTRDAQARQLDGIDGLTTPHCVRFTFETAADLQKVFEDNAFRFPVLVRPSQYQTGKGLQRIDCAADWDRLLYTQWYRQDHFMIQYEDSRTEEGIYLKVRVVFVGEKPFVRHVKAGPDWLVHNDLSAEAVPSFKGRELAVIDALEADSTFMGICHEIGRRTGLDFCGADIGVDLARGRFVLFEANPSMSVFFPLRPGLSKAELARRDRLQGLLTDCFMDCLKDPATWAGPQR